MGITTDWHGHEQTVGVAALAARVDDVVADGAVAVALADLDHFAEDNEARGDEANDRALQAWIDTLTGSLPKDAIVGRLGAEEFGVALPNTSAEDALILLEEVRSHLADHPVGGRTIGATFGVAARPPHATETAELFRRADDALARGRREGGGRVSIYVEEKMVLKSNYYSRASLARLSKLAGRLQRTEASLLREALDNLIQAQR